MNGALEHQGDASLLTGAGGKGLQQKGVVTRVAPLAADVFVMEAP